jgi:hypothetical protein
MYAQWQSMEAYESMRRDPAPIPYLKEALTFAAFEPGAYEVVESWSSARDQK